MTLSGKSVISAKLTALKGISLCLQQHWYNLGWPVCQIIENKGLSEVIIFAILFSAANSTEITRFTFHLTSQAILKCLTGITAQSNKFTESKRVIFFLLFIEGYIKWTFI